ncbi:penicillin acylase family protein [Virgisporangium aurantiacum]|uniref:Penicillin amidase n=1 Tax=Virgisporangium aurantiacum TaxID=175570 RepID=A0A8J3Z267_9ACTN|nr:penicillin acylase family protein [Virgisporangium aurantiacum]GIJ54948.1 hypothetical protein Vau01_024640 [Virgisporangium aurantiacum]
MRRSRVALFSVGLLAAAVAAVPDRASAEDTVEVPGLRGAGSIVRDVDGVPHLRATDPYDLFYLQGWVHADDRLFQMDVSRRTASGTLAELLGESALPGDVQMRTIGLRRAAERGLPAQSPETQGALRAYADGVNAFVARHDLPGQYRSLKLSTVDPWTPVDSLAVIKLIAFGLSFDLDIDRTLIAQAYRTAGAKAGFDGAAAVREDLFRVEPFTPAATVPDAIGRHPRNATSAGTAAAAAPTEIPASALALAADYQRRVEQVPVIADALDREVHHGSNSWVVGGRHTATGRPILASDPHLAAEAPSVAYPIGLHGAGFETAGDGFPGSPFVVLGHNRDVVWGATMNPMDVTDTFVEQLRTDPASPSGLSTVYQGRLEHVQAIDETFRVNTRTGAVAVVPPGGAIPARTLVVPRRNNGPLLTMDPAAGTALSVQYTGFSATRELDAFRLIDTARDVDDFRNALRFFDVGSQNFTYADARGHIAHFTSGEQPLREDLQAGAVRGNPPFQLRDGTGGNEWLPLTNRRPADQAVPFQVLPFTEMPQVVDPPTGVIVTANNDPAGNTLDNDLLNQFRPGGGIFYLGVVYDGQRAGRVTDLLRTATAHGAGRVTVEDVKNQQADTTLLDAQFFTPYLTAALDGARDPARASRTPELAALAADRRVIEAVGRLARWRYTTPTGIPEGYDAADRDGRLDPPTRQEVDESIAATLYTLWRGRTFRTVIDAPLNRISPDLPVPNDRDSFKTLKKLLADFDKRQGVGASGIDFFALPGVADPADRRDVLLLRGMAESLDLLAGDRFATAFGRATDQDAYRWGRLHRVTFASPLGAPYSVPSVGNPVRSPLPGLAGLPVDGGLYTVDVANFNSRADNADGFVMRFAPARRFVAQPAAVGMRAESSLPGGVSEEIGDRWSGNLLGRYLTNDTYPVRLPPTSVLTWEPVHRDVRR